MRLNSSIAINRAAVVGAGVMGAAIAAHLANVGIPVVLLDAVPTALTAEEGKRKLTLQHPSVRNRLVRAGLDRAARASPANFASPDFVERVTTGLYLTRLGHQTAGRAYLASAELLV